MLNGAAALCETCFGLGLLGPAPIRQTVCGLLVVMHLLIITGSYFEPIYAIIPWNILCLAIVVGLGTAEQCYLPTLQECPSMVACVVLLLFGAAPGLSWFEWWHPQASTHPVGHACVDTLCVTAALFPDAFVQLP